MWDGLNVTFIHDRSVVPLGGVDGGRAEMQWDLNGDPDGGRWRLVDDPSELTTGAFGDSTFTMYSPWGNFADGGVIGALDGASWELIGQFANIHGAAGQRARRDHGLDRLFG